MKKAIVIGAGINGLVAANYLQRNGFLVTHLEKKRTVGGACASDVATFGDKKYSYSNGASAFGFMQDFVFEETGLANYISTFTPNHPEVIYYKNQEAACFFHEDPAHLKQELLEKWNEQGRVEEFLQHRELVREFLIRNFRAASVPTIELAQHELGAGLTQRWILGTARELLDYYFTSNKTKMFFTIEVTESGPVSIDSPYSAFNIGLMASGGMFEGKWGFVKGGISQIARTLAAINYELGVHLMTNVDVNVVSPKLSLVEFSVGDQTYVQRADIIVFATDPLTAAQTLHDADLEQQVRGKKQLGTSGKVILFFKKPVRWKNPTNHVDFDSAFRFIIASETPDMFEASSKLVESKERDYSEGYLEIYCEGAGRRKLGEEMDYDIVAVFAKNMTITKNGREIPDAKQRIAGAVLSKMENPGDMIGSILLTPKDIKETFYMPQGNIDHTELCEGQTYIQRTFSSNPKQSFYQFGEHENIYYCGSASYPCGSVAGTPGYMCAHQIVHKHSAVLNSVH